MNPAGLLVLLLWACWSGALHAAGAAPSFRVATYNLENYLDQPAGTRPAKSDAAKAKVRESIRALDADVLAVQEMGSRSALFELQASLRQHDAVVYPHWEWVQGFDTNIHLAVLSKFPIVARRSHTNESFLLNGRRFWVSRGFAEVDIRVNAHYTFTLMTAHLKSRREVGLVDEAAWREQEARRLRELIDERLRANPDLNLVVLGDLNDTHDSRPVKLLLGRGKLALIDTRPAERNGDAPAARNGDLSSRQITWTHFYGVKDAYERIDYLLLSPGMAREWDRSGTYVLALPDWGVASDHRPIVARFWAEDR
jgi:endonuclease/exonuclease/phosphatase family metal-dependent hydrolase